jgi:hypothetical protein
MAVIVFADIRSPGTIANLGKNPAVELNTVDPFVYGLLDGTRNL